MTLTEAAIGAAIPSQPHSTPRQFRDAVLAEVKKPFLFPSQHFVYRKVPMDGGLASEIASLLGLPMSQVSFEDMGGFLTIPEGKKLYEDFWNFAFQILSTRYQHGNDGIDCNDIADMAIQQLRFGDNPSYGGVAIGAGDVPLETVDHRTNFCLYFDNGILRADSLDFNPSALFFSPPPNGVFPLTFWSSPYAAAI